MSENKLLKAALTYREKFGFSVVPSKDKKPLVEWMQYQEEKPSIDQITEWWLKWPDAGISIITGKISNITVIDFDWHSINGDQTKLIKEQFPDVATPHVNSARGGEHLYFEYCPDMPNKRIIDGLDIKNDHGVIVAPPSIFEGKQYKWNPQARIDEMQFRSFPDRYKNSINILINSLYTHDVSYDSSQNLTELTKPNIYYKEGRRDEDLFHAANCLVKGGADPQFTLQTLELIANNLGKGFGPKEAKQKFDSAIKRIGRQDINIAEEVRQWIELTEGNFDLTSCSHELTITNKNQKQALYMAIKRLCDEGVIEKYGEKRGVYRRIEKSKYEDWINADYNPIKINLPFGMNDYVEIFPGDLIVIAGVKNAGKTALALNFIEMNIKQWDCYYHSSELVKQTFKLRVSKSDNANLSDWSKVKMTSGLSMACAKDRVVKNALNIFDYIEGDEGEFYKIPSTMAKIHRVIGDGVAVICLQKPAERNFARGGEGTKDKAALYLTIDKKYPYHICRVVECKAFKRENPEGCFINYKVHDGINLFPDGILLPEIDEKYKGFV